MHAAVPPLPPTPCAGQRRPAKRCLIAWGERTAEKNVGPCRSVQNVLLILFDNDETVFFPDLASNDGIASPPPFSLLSISTAGSVMVRAGSPSLPRASLSLGDRRRGCGLDPSLQRPVPQTQVMDAPARNSSYVGQRQGEQYFSDCLFFLLCAT